jgi:hypothetical protein
MNLDNITDERQSYKDYFLKHVVKFYISQHLSKFIPVYFAFLNKEDG